MCDNSTATTQNTSPEIKPKEMTADEYSALVAKWQQAYYAWNASCIQHYNMIALNSSQQILRQIPININAYSFGSINEIVRLQRVDPLTDIRSSRIRIASLWRRFLAEAIDFILLHTLKILIVFVLSSHFDIVDENRFTFTYMISNYLYDETFSFPIELICIELGYLFASIVFESFCLVRYGATPGKRLLRLRVLKSDHIQIQDNGDLTIEPVAMLSGGAAFTRSSYKSIMSTFLFPAIIVALFTTQHRQTSYDIAANAIVVELQPRV